MKSLIYIFESLLEMACIGTIVKFEVLLRLIWFVKYLLFTICCLVRSALRPPISAWLCEIMFSLCCMAAGPAAPNGLLNWLPGLPYMVMASRGGSNGCYQIDC